MKEDVGKKIRLIRKTAKLSQERFGNKIGISGKTISAYETGAIIPSLKILENISNTYDVNIVSLSENYKGTVKEKVESIEKTLEDLKTLLTNL